MHSARVRAALHSTEEPLVVDLGYGRVPVTTLELAARLREVAPAVRVVGLEIDPERVAAARSAAEDGVEFALGGFELAGLRPVLVRAFNVLRQYDESEVAAAWALMQGRLTDTGLLIEGTCDEIGRLASWITLTRERPILFTVSLRLAGLENPSKVAERLPKALIHHNVAGERIHDFLQALDLWWNTHAPLGVFGASQRWIAVCKSMTEAGWPIKQETKRWRLGEITVDWDAVEP
jgi:hypothetical protein